MSPATPARNTKRSVRPQDCRAAQEQVDRKRAERDSAKGTQPSPSTNPVGAYPVRGRASAGQAESIRNSGTLVTHDLGSVSD
jgi:hypothetical protein